MKTPITYVTSNPGKFEEVNNFIQTYAPHITLMQYDHEMPEMQSRDQRAIALQKAQHAWNELKSPLLVDDSGIYFNQYQNFPGTITKQVFEGIGFEGIKLLLTSNNRAYFHLHLVYMDHEGTPHVFEGKVDGAIIIPNDYSHQRGFPYNAIFKPEGCNKTYAELFSTAEHANYSYRLHAVEKFLTWFNRAADL